MQGHQGIAQHALDMHVVGFLASSLWTRIAMPKQNSLVVCNSVLYGLLLFYCIDLGVCNIETNISIFLGIFSITIIRRYFAECVMLLISDYCGQLQCIIFFIFCDVCSVHISDRN